LDIYSDSEYVIRSIVYWAPEHVQLGWKCANADLLQDIVSWIKFQSAPVQFIHVKAHSGNIHSDAADSAAKAGACLLLPSEDYIPCKAPHVSLNMGSAAGFAINDRRAYLRHTAVCGKCVELARCVESDLGVSNCRIWYILRYTGPVGQPLIR
jgi:hypothetical protein